MLGLLGDVIFHVGADDDIVDDEMGDLDDEANLSEILAEIDTDKDGFVSWEELAGIVDEQVAKEVEEDADADESDDDDGSEAMRFFFDQADADKDGMLSPDELFTMIKSEVVKEGDEEEL